MTLRADQIDVLEEVARETLTANIRRDLLARDFKAAPAPRSALEADGAHARLRAVVDQGFARGLAEEGDFRNLGHLAALSSFAPFRHPALRLTLGDYVGRELAKRLRFLVQQSKRGG